jgi:hypothetical protein
MNKFCLICASVACLSFFSSCNKNENENHGMSIVYPENFYSVSYADEVNDSLVFETFDSYVATPYEADWITITAGASYDVTYSPYNLYTFKSLLAFTPNTTGKTRYGRVLVKGYDGGTTAPFYFQLGFLNINNPVPTFQYSDELGDFIPESASFDLQVAADATTDSICFTVANPWTLTFSEGADQTWLTLDKTSGEKNHNNVTIRLTPNTDKDNARSTSLVLKSGEVTNTINVKQLAAKKEEND